MSKLMARHVEIVLNPTQFNSGSVFRQIQHITNRTKDFSRRAYFLEIYRVCIQYCCQKRSDKNVKVSAYTTFYVIYHRGL